MGLHYFDKQLHEINSFIGELAANLGHPEDKNQAIILLKATLHTIRDRITMGESLDLISQFPTILKGLYVEGWKYHEKPPLNFKDMESFTETVKSKQESMGEQRFNWPEPTQDLVKKVLDSLKRYVSEGQAMHVMGQMPREIQEIF